VPHGDERSKEDLLGVIEKQRRELAMRDKRIDELEEYVDRLLARVLNTCPQILHVAGGAPKRRLRF
jgi:Rab11 family-interacting protein 1/2/5